MLGVQALGMRRRPANLISAPLEPDIDADGVDRAQIRAMLALLPEERLRRVEEFVESALEIRELNETRPVG
jgi:hypothetical protein